MRQFWVIFSHPRSERRRLVVIFLERLVATAALGAGVNGEGQVRGPRGPAKELR